MDLTITVSVFFHANVVFVQPTDNSSHGESGNVNAMSTHFKKNTLNKSSMKRPLEMEAILEPKRAFSSRYKRDEPLDFKCDVHSITRSLLCNERGFPRIIDHILIKIDL